LLHNGHVVVPGLLSALTGCARGWRGSGRNRAPGRAGRPGARTGRVTGFGGPGGRGGQTGRVTGIGGPGGRGGQTGRV